MALYIPSKNLLFIHIPKTGGMSIRHALMNNFGSEAEEIGHAHELMSSVNEILSYSKLINPFSFAFVRNPYEWAVSLYNFMCEAEEDFESFLLAKEMNFDDFIYWLCECVEKKGNMFPIMPCRQYEYIYDTNGKSLIDGVGRYELFSFTWNAICDKFDIQSTIRHINKTKNTIPLYERFQKKETRQQFENTFALDFELLKYPLWQ